MAKGRMPRIRPRLLQHALSRRRVLIHYPEALTRRIARVQSQPLTVPRELGRRRRRIFAGHAVTYVPYGVAYKPYEIVPAALVVIHAYPARSGEQLFQRAVPFALFKQLFKLIRHSVVKGRTAKLRRFFGPVIVVRKGRMIPSRDGGMPAAPFKEDPLSK